MMPHLDPEYAFWISGVKWDGYYYELGRIGRRPPHQYQKSPRIWGFPGSSPSPRLQIVQGWEEERGLGRRGLAHVWDYPALL